MKSQDFAAGTGASAKAKPFSIRLTDAEKAALEAKAGGMPLGVFIRKAVLEAAAERRARRSPVRDADALGRLLALLGQSEIGPALRKLAGHADSGTLYIDEHTKGRVHAACDDVRAMRFLLLEALGKEILSDVLPAQASAADVFHIAAAPGIAPSPDAGSVEA